MSDELQNETLLQSSTSSIVGMPNVQVEDHEINIRIMEHELRQEGELGVENEAVCVTEAFLNVEDIINPYKYLLKKVNFSTETSNE